MEESYTRIYNLMMVDKGSQPQAFNVYLLDYLSNKFKGMKHLVDNMVVSIIFSSYQYLPKYPDASIFYKLLSDIYSPADLAYFIFLRALVEKETKAPFYRGQEAVDMRLLYLSKGQMAAVLNEVFGVGNTPRINRFYQVMYEAHPHLRHELKVKSYEFIAVCLADYYRARRDLDQQLAENILPQDEIILKRMREEKTRAKKTPPVQTSQPTPQQAPPDILIDNGELSLPPRDISPKAQSKAAKGAETGLSGGNRTPTRPSSNKVSTPSSSKTSQFEHRPSNTMLSPSFSRYTRCEKATYCLRHRKCPKARLSVGEVTPPL